MSTIYEIYVYNDQPIETGFFKGSKAGEVSGWDIKFIKCEQGEKIQDYPFFDCVITVNDCPDQSLIQNFKKDQ